MRDFIDVFPKQLRGAGGSRRGFPWASAARRVPSGLTLCLIIGTAIFATIAGSLSMEGANASPPPATGRASQRVETAFASFNLQPAQTGADTPQKENACRDITFFFLHASCSTPGRRQLGRIHRSSAPRSAALSRHP